MNVAEWGELPSHGMQHFDGDEQWLITGLIRAEMNAEHRARWTLTCPANREDVG